MKALTSHTGVFLYYKEIRSQNNGLKEQILENHQSTQMFWKVIMKRNFYEGE
jgi:hypothetical protein